MDRHWLLWSSRVLGLFVCLFAAMFALDALDLGIFPLFVHLLPAALLFIVVVASWRWPWIGGVSFIAFGLLYAVMMRARPEWVLWISGPLFAAGGLYVVSWRTQKATRRLAR
jgi:hypothetical protein